MYGNKGQHKKRVDAVKAELALLEKKTGHGMTQARSQRALAPWTRVCEMCTRCTLWTLFNWSCDAWDVAVARCVGPAVLLHRVCADAPRHESAEAFASSFRVENFGVAQKAADDGMLITEPLAVRRDEWSL